MNCPLRSAFVPLLVIGVAATGLGFTLLHPQSKVDTATPPAIVATYDSLADAILAVKASEANLVRALLDGGYAHAQALAARARAAIDAKDTAKAKQDLEALAALVAQLGAEGDNAVAGVRKRLLEGGHHHNAEGEKQGVYDPGFVIVTRKAKESLLKASQDIAKVASAPDAAALQKAWGQVDAAWTEIAPRK